MSLKLTPEQESAIASRGRVIVSASAGSGKTFVMIERLVSLILGGADVKNALAVTFTKKAAAQMRERLRAALIKQLSHSTEQERARLKEQLSALPLTDISTIHAFCARLVRTYFYLADVDPAFRVISPDDHDGMLLVSRALDEVFERGYEEKDEAFFLLLSVYFRNKKDALLRKIVVGLYHDLRGRADYLDCLEGMGKEDEFEEVCAYLAEDVRSRAAFIMQEAQRTGEALRGKNKGGEELCAQVRAAAEPLMSGDLFGLKEREQPPIRRAPPATRAEGEERRCLKYAAKLAASVKELYKELTKYAPREEEYARYTDGRRIASALAALVLRFDESYARLKREAGVLDYDDLEHCALSVLENEEARAAVLRKYRYVFVDEYQDVNPAQERILSLLSGEEVFLVGDAKQSIYSFRGSRSEYFMKKCGEFCSLALTENFRSAPAVLEAVNRVFCRAMTKESAGLSYRDAPMRGGSRYGVHDGGVFFRTVPAREKEERPERGIYSVLAEAKKPIDEQAELVCRLVEEEVGSDWFDADAGMVRKLGFGDIAVLVRYKDRETGDIISALSERDVPVATEASVNVCDFWEARLIVDWLSFLDNGEQDVPLAGAMLSRVGGFCEEDLAEIRLAYPGVYNFRDACRRYASKNRDGLKEPIKDALCEKLNTFTQKVEEYRTWMQVRSAAEIIAQLLSDGLEAEIAAKKDGEARLRRVWRLAEEGEESVNAFLRRLKALDHQVKYAEGGGENAVKVLTMHAAKGLEFPVVILVGLDTCFRGERDEVLCTDRFLFAPKSYDLQNKVVHETVLRRASALYNDREEVKGELNLLYVAMTRAKFRLHMLFRGRESALAPQYAERFSDFIDFSECGGYFTAEKEQRETALPRSALVYRPDEKMLVSLQTVYQKPYPFAESARLPVKSSATDLMQLWREEAPAEHGQRGKGGTVEEGLAYHAFLENVRFGSPAEEELARMEREGILSAEQLALLDAEKLKKILALPALSSLEGKRVWREQTFLISLPASEIPVLNSSASEEIVLQGALDLLAEDEEGYLILDYKYSAHDAARLQQDYAPQIALYRKAVARVKGVDARTIRAKLINIFGLFEVEM